MAILWLASYPKSGNTWLRAFIANYLDNGAHPVGINRLPELSFSDNRARYFEQVAGRPASEMSWPDINRWRPHVHRLLARARPGLVAVKTHSAMIVAEGVPTITVEVSDRAIYIVRNPLDVVVSFAHHYGLPLDNAVRAMGYPGLKTRPSADQVPQLLADWSRHVASWTQTEAFPVLTVRYEDMLARPLATFGAVVRFLNLPADRARLRRALRRSDFRVLAEQERREGFVEASSKAETFFRRGTAGGWRASLSEEQVTRVVRQHGPLMTRFGYRRDDGTLVV